MKFTYALLLVPVLVLASCGTTPANKTTPMEPDKSNITIGSSTGNTTPLPVSANEAPPVFPTISGEWDLEIYGYGNATEEQQGYPNLKGTVTFQAEGNKVTGTYKATVRPDDVKKPNENREFSYIVEPSFWQASKTWDAQKNAWVSNESLPFVLRPKFISPEPDDYPNNLLCQLFTGSRVEKPKSGKETYTLNCNILEKGKPGHTLKAVLEKIK